MVAWLPSGWMLALKLMSYNVRSSSCRYGKTSVSSAFAGFLCDKVMSGLNKDFAGKILSYSDTLRAVTHRLQHSSQIVCKII